MKLIGKNAKFNDSNKPIESTHAVITHGQSNLSLGFSKGHLKANEDEMLKVIDSKNPSILNIAEQNTQNDIRNDILLMPRISFDKSG